MKIYNYSVKTGEFTRESEARLDPLESKLQGKDVFLKPANSTTIEPPAVGNLQAAAFIDGKWEIVHDFRDTVYFIGSDIVRITDIGIEPPGGTTTDPPPEELARPFYDGYKWIDQAPDPVAENPLVLTPAVIADLVKEKDFAAFKTKLQTLSDGAK